MTTGLVQTLRVVTLSPEFTRALHRAIAEQSRLAWDQPASEAAPARLYETKTSADLSRLAVARCHGNA